MNNTPFKVCPNCNVTWETMDDFLSDPTLEAAGYQVNFADLKGGLFYFTHYVENCRTTMAIEVAQFASLSDRPLLANRLTQKPEGCSGLCVRKGDSAPCPLACECVWVREVMQVIKERKR